MHKRLAQAISIALLAGCLLGADSREARFSRLGHQMICACSCGQVLLECNHVGCQDSDRMIGELRQQLAGSDNDKVILQWFEQKYGASVLAAPIRGGFDAVAWIAPGVIFILATAGTAFVIRSWTSRKRSIGPAGAYMGQDAVDAPTRARIRREMEL